MGAALVSGAHTLCVAPSPQVQRRRRRGWPFGMPRDASRAPRSGGAARRTGGGRSCCGDLRKRLLGSRVSLWGLSREPASGGPYATPFGRTLLRDVPLGGCCWGAATSGRYPPLPGVAGSQCKTTPPPPAPGAPGCTWSTARGNSPVSGTADPRSSQTGQVIRGLC